MSCVFQVSSDEPILGTATSVQAEHCRPIHALHDGSQCYGASGADVQRYVLFEGGTPVKTFETPMENTVRKGGLHQHQKHRIRNVSAITPNKKLIILGIGASENSMYFLNLGDRRVTQACIERSRQYKQDEKKSI